MLTLINVNVTFFNVNVNAPLTPPTLPRPSSTRMARARSAAERRSEGAGLARDMRAEVGALPPQRAGGGRNHQNKFDQNAPRASKPRPNPSNHLEKFALSTQQTAGRGKIKNQKTKK